MKKFIIRVLYPGWRLWKFCVLQPLFLIEDTWLIWRLRNHRSVALQEHAPLPRDAVQERIVRELREHGISMTHLDELFPNSSWLPDLQSYGNAQKEKAFNNKVKTFWNEMWDYRRFRMDLDNPFLRFALEERNLAIVSAYLGMYARFHALSLSETVPVAAGAEAIQSQKWHRDAGNKKYVKIFLYLNDVDTGCGPFTYVKDSQPGGRFERVFPQVSPYASTYGRVEEEELRTLVPQAHIIEATGRAGTLIFADTVGLHKGSYATKGSRFASITSYYSDKTLARKKNRFEYPTDFEERVSTLSPAAQFAVRQRP